jgi:hypothetical protein
MSTDWVTEASEWNFAQVFEQKSFADAQLGNRVCHQDLFRLRVGAETGSQLNRRSKKIVILFDRFSCCGANSNLERVLGVRFFVLGQFALDLNCASDRPRCRYK